jgi:hypothetical protein
MDHEDPERLELQEDCWRQLHERDLGLRMWCRRIPIQGGENHPVWARAPFAIASTKRSFAL